MISQSSRFSKTACPALLFLAFTGLARACPVCFSAPDSPETRSMTMAILFLLGTVGLVICGIGSFFVYLIAKEKEPLPPHEELNLTTLDQPTVTH